MSREKNATPPTTTKTALKIRMNYTAVWVIRYIRFRT